MRPSTVAMILLAASTALSLPIDSRQNPANNHLKDDGPELCGSDPDCETLERGDAYHTLDEFSGHGGRQGEIVTHGTGKALTDAGLPPAVGETDAKAGDIVEGELFDTARKRGAISEGLFYWETPLRRNPHQKPPPIPLSPALVRAKR